MEIAAKIKSYRERNGLTQLELSLKLACQPDLISKWERGCVVPGTHYQRLFQRLLEEETSKESSNEEN